MVVEHDRQAGAAFFGSFHLGDHVLEKKEAAVVYPRHTGTEPSREASGFVFGSDMVGDHLPLHTKRRIRQKVVETAVGVLVVVEAVPEPDPRGVLALDEHVSPTRSIGFGVDFLPVHMQAALGIEVAQVFLGYRQHAPGSTSRVASL